METKLDDKRLEGTRVKMGFHSAFGVSNKGKSGGITLLWKEDVRLEIRNFTPTILMPM